MFYALCILSVTLQGGIIIGWNSIAALFPYATTKDWAFAAGCNALSATVSSLALSKGFSSKTGVLIGTMLTSSGIALLAVAPETMFRVACVLIAAGGPAHHTSMLWSAIQDNEHIRVTVISLINCGFETSALMFHCVNLMTHVTDLQTVLIGFALLTAFLGCMVYLFYPIRPTIQHVQVYELMPTNCCVSAVVFIAWFMACSQCLQSYIASVSTRAPDAVSTFDVILAFGWVCMPIVSWCISTLDDTTNMCLVLSVMATSLQISSWPGVVLVSLGRYMLYTILFIATHRLYGADMAGNVLASSFTGSAVLSLSQSVIHVPYIPDNVLAIATPFAVAIIPFFVKYIPLSSIYTLYQSEI